MLDGLDTASIEMEEAKVLPSHDMFLVINSSLCENTHESDYFNFSAGQIIRGDDFIRDTTSASLFEN